MVWCELQLKSGIKKTGIVRLRTVSYGFAKPRRGATHRFLGVRGARFLGSARGPTRADGRGRAGSRASGLLWSLCLMRRRQPRVAQWPRPPACACCRVALAAADKHLRPHIVQLSVRKFPSFLRVGELGGTGHAPFIGAVAAKWHVNFLTLRFLDARD